MMHSATQLDDLGLQPQQNILPQFNASFDLFETSVRFALIELQISLDQENEVY